MKLHPGCDVLEAYTVGTCTGIGKQSFECSCIEPEDNISCVHSSLGIRSIPNSSNIET